jgi:cytochrome c-type biogenesis protein CcmH/NrfG
MATDRSNANSARRPPPADAASEEAKSAREEAKSAREEAKRAARQQWLKEGVTALLGIGIVGYTLYMTYRAFGMVGDTTRMGNAKDLLTYLSGFAGVVVGYYFGRVPADARTAQAQQQMGQAMSDKGQTMNKMDDMKKEMAHLEDKMDDMKEEMAHLADKMDSGEHVTAADIRHVHDMA